MIQTQQSDNRYWSTMHSNLSNPYSPHFRGYTSPPLHHSSLHHAPLHHHHSSVHHSPISNSHHSSHLMHSSYTTSAASMNQFAHAQSQGAPEPRSVVERDIPQYSDSLMQSQALDGFPTRTQFEDLLNEYILSLSPKKRDKALIPQKRYDNIAAVLKDPKCTTIESAQFRFWAKKMFRLSTEDGSIVCHEGKPVAVREQLYQVLTESHNRAQHGGRDKTSAEVRKHYSWVPKELIARFVRHCPSCTLRRSSPLDYPSLSSRTQDTYSKLDMSPSPPYTKNMDTMGAPSPPYSNASSPSSGMSPIHRHSSNDSLGSPLHTGVPVTSQSMPQLQAMATGSVMMSTGNGSSEVAYQYVNGYNGGLGETAGGGMSLEHGIYGRGAN